MIGEDKFVEIIDKPNSSTPGYIDRSEVGKKKIRHRPHKLRMKVK